MCFGYSLLTKYVIEELHERKMKAKKKDKDRVIDVDEKTLWYPAFNAEAAPVIPVYTNCGHPAGYYCSACEPKKEKKKASPIFWAGSTKKEVDAQNAAIHAAQRAVPYEYSKDLQYWVKELDGTYTLRTHGDIGKNCLPGDWKQSDDGWWYWVCKEEKKKKKEKKVDTKTKIKIVTFER